MSNANLTRIEAGRYEGTICGVAVRVVRSVTGYHPHAHTFVHTPEWKVTIVGGRCIADGHQTMSGAVASAVRTLA